MSTDNLTPFIEALRDSPLFDDSQYAQVTDLVIEQQGKCSEPEPFLTLLCDRGLLTPFQAQQLAAQGVQSLILGQYVLLEKLGEGGMGTVFKARHQRMKRLVAVKLIRQDGWDNVRDVQRFTQEIEAAAQLTHPNVVHAYDANEVDGLHFFVMEYVEGIDLSKLVHEHGPLSFGQACEFFRQAALGLQHAHERGLVHRDIKPSNLLVSFADATVKILDMGLARLQQPLGSAASPLTQTGMVMGTPDFISPEQARDSRAVDIRSDLYSLGCTLYFLLSGQVPHPEGTFTEKMLKHNMEDPKPLADWCPTLPEGVLAIVQKLMAKRPEDRFQTPAELAEALAPHAEPQRSAEKYRPASMPKIGPHVATVVPSQMPLIRPGLSAMARMPPDRRGEATSGQVQPTPSLRRTVASGPAPAAMQSRTAQDAVPAPPPSPPAPPVWRRSRLPMLALIAAAAVGLGLAFAWKSLRETDPGPVAVQTGPAGEPTSKTVVTPPTVPATEPRKDVLPVKPPDKKEPEVPPAPQLGIVAEFRERKALAKPEPLKASVSRDGRWVLAAWGDQLRFWDLDHLRKNDEANHALDLEEQPISAVAVAGDGSRAVFAFTRDDPNPPKGKVLPPAPVVAVWTPSSPRKPALLRGHTKEITCLAISPRGTYALSGSLDMTVRYWDLEQNKEIRSLLHGDRVTSVAYAPDGTLALSGGRDNRVILWNLETGEKLHTFREHKDPITCLAFSPDGRTALSGSQDKQIVLYDLEKRQVVRTFRGHTEDVRCLAFSRDGRQFLSGGADEVLRLWNVAEHEPVQRYEEHRGAVTGAAFSPDGKYAVSISADNTVQRRSLLGKAP